MLNDSYWEEYNDGERAFLWSADGERIGNCMIYPELIAESFYYNGTSSIKEVEWQVTLYIGNKCNRIANQLHKIRDHLPSIHELADKAMETK